ncbi:hypothetical protein LOTGIDRAFT_170592 [Lottia gigantea]|uniref:Uncharacterized protein n=1 Tax=Lottia gigantea TaxID=225164 RepID=V4CQ82_LOTGI|nr:hypothetical protein LOTGIDRAFT_170592 [Lottia gigantea]ESP04620.1 hypothetical protein LOTGIDRAFT_170592 [Lottia gigantea]
MSTERTWDTFGKEIMFSVAEPKQSVQRKSCRKEPGHAYRLKMKKTEAKLPRPVVFFSDFEKDAYRRNRAEECKLQNTLQNLQRAQSVTEKTIRCQSAKFKLDKAHLINAYKKTTSAGTRDLKTPLMLVNTVSQSSRQRKKSVFIPRSVRDPRPLSESSSSSTEEYVEPIQTKIPGHSDSMITRPSTWAVRPQTTLTTIKTDNSKRCKSADSSKRLKYYKKYTENFVDVESISKSTDVPTRKIKFLDKVDTKPSMQHRKSLIVTKSGLGAWCEAL